MNLEWKRRDVITDITAECEYFDVEGLGSQPAHIGILRTAENILRKIESLDLLAESFRRHPDYALLVTGHSLGAGTAVMLSLMLRKTYAHVRCIAYSPPGCLVSHALARFTKSFIMSVVVGDDIVPRLSVRAVHNLKADILKELYNCSLPKYKIIWKYSISCFGVSDSSSRDNGGGGYGTDETSERNSAVSNSGLNSPVDEASDLENGNDTQRKVTVAAVTSAPGRSSSINNTNEDPLNLSSNSASSQKQLIVFSDNEIIGILKGLLTEYSRILNIESPFGIAYIHLIIG